MTDTFTLWQVAADSLPKGLAIVDRNGCILFTNRTWISMAFSHGYSPLWDRPGINIISHFTDEAGSEHPLSQNILHGITSILSGSTEYYSVELCLEHQGNLWYLMEASPLKIEDPPTNYGMMLLFTDITSYKESERRLREAASHRCELHGLLPICAVCKKIKDEGERWNSIEEYLRQHTCAEFTHDICPDCIRLLYPKYSSVLDSPDKHGGGY